MIKLFLYLAILFSIVIKVEAQNDTSFFSGDTLVEYFYFKNGNIRAIRKYEKGIRFYLYGFQASFYKNGRIKYLNYMPFAKDTAFYTSKRRNGTVKNQSVYYNGRNEDFKENRRGMLIEKSVSNANNDTIKTYAYKRGKLYATEKREIEKQYETVEYYRGQVGGNSAVVIINNGSGKKYIVNNKEMTAREYQNYDEVYQEHINKREAVHYYREFSKDSVLIYEGLFKNVDMPCGEYKEYNMNGTLKLRGRYNNEGKKDWLWIYCDNNGEFLGVEYYENGIKR